MRFYNIVPCTAPQAILQHLHKPEGLHLKFSSIGSIYLSQSNLRSFFSCCTSYKNGSLPIFLLFVKILFIIQVVN